jgi:hypothetical protein
MQLLAFEMLPVNHVLGIIFVHRPDDRAEFKLSEAAVCTFPAFALLQNSCELT